MNAYTLREALLRGDREAVTRMLSAGTVEQLKAEKNALLHELTDAHLRGEIPFCQLTAAAQAACAFHLENGPFIACCGSVAGSLLTGMVDYIWAYPRVMCIFWFVFALGLASVKLAGEEKGVRHV